MTRRNRERSIQNKTELTTFNEYCPQKRAPDGHATGRFNPNQR